MTVAAELIDAMISLTSLMEDETSKLGRVGNLAELAEIAGSKVKLGAWIEVEVVRLRRESPDWMSGLDAGTHAALAEASRTLRDTSLVNAQVIERQIELSVDIMAAIAGEAQRLTGRRSSTYGASGDVSRTESSAPISINTRL